MVLFATLTANAQSFILSGNIVDKQQSPLIGATVRVQEIKKGTSTDVEGAFKLNLPKGTYTIQVSYIGYQTVYQTILANKNQRITIQLTEDENILDEVLVSAVRVKATAPVTHSNLSKKDIAKRNLGQDIPMLLNYLPSVVSSSDAGAGIGYTYLNVRGSDSERINVTINGIPYNDAESQGTFWVNMGDFASSTQNLQLQRGVGTSTNGSGAFGASLNILTDAISEKAFGEISNSVGSYNTKKHTVKFSTGKINNHIEIAGRLSKIYSDGYIDRAYADLKSYFLQASYVDDNTLIKALTFGGKEKTYQAWYGIDADQLAADRRQNPYTYENEIDNYQQDHYQLHWNEKLNDNWSTNIGLNYTRGQGYFEQFKANDKVSKYNGIVVATNGSKTDLIVRRWLDNKFYVANFNANYTNEHLEIISGFSYSNYTNDHFGEVIWAKEFAPTANIRDRYYFSDAKKTEFSIFSKATYKIGEQLAVYVDLQGRFIQYKTGGLTSKRAAIDVDENFRFFNPKLGVTYTVNPQNSLYFSFARANKEPKRNDFKNGISTHESLNDFELGWRLKNENIKINTNLYYMSYQNQLVLTGAINDVGSAIRATSGKSYRLGVEVDADITLSEQLSLRPNIAISKNRNQDFYAPLNGSVQNLGNTPLSFSPNVIFGNIFTYAPTEHFQVAFLSKYVGKQYLSNLNSSVSKLDVLGSYFTSDLNLVYTIEPNSIFKEVVLTALVNNIFDKEYVDRGYYYTYDDTWSSQGATTTVDGAGYYPQATRNFLVGVTLKF
jgi:iron complex outermembrane receptor protein